jgi:hypothetical protein
VKDVREDEAIAVDPIWILRIERHELIEKNMTNGRHSHRRTWVSRVCFKGGIDL